MVMLSKVNIIVLDLYSASSRDTRWGRKDLATENQDRANEGNVKGLHAGPVRLE